VTTAWKYNNDYVDGNDGYRHSKWLSFMEKRLLLAKRLLNPDNSVIIVAIDEKESARLSLLLGQVFPSAEIQMVSVVIKPGGTSRSKTFSRVEEYLYFVFIGEAEVIRTGDAMLTDPVPADTTPAITDSDLWEGMIRRGIGVVRAKRPKQFYPIFIDASTGRIAEIGSPLAADADRNEVASPAALTAVWPIKDDGTEGFWQLSPGGLRKALAQGTVRVGSFNKRTGQWRVQYMKAQNAKYVTDGVVAVAGRDINGAVIIAEGQAQVKETATPRTVWVKPSHDASVNGAGLLNKLLVGRKFPFPKSLYAVEDALRFFVKDKPNALIIDFFGGSGTTAHAVMRLNRQDGGRRRAILVTNNEIGPDAEKKMTEAGKSPGDPEWEALGIFEYITKPRLEAAVTGKTHEGKAVQGDYKFNDEFPMSDGFEENIEFFTLTYEDADRVRLGAAFAAVAPMLWLMAGAVGPRVEKVVDGWALPAGGRYGVLFDADDWPGFVDAVKAAEGLTHAFVVTDSDAVFQRVVAELPDAVTPVRLYESYLRSFAINTGVPA